MTYYADLGPCDYFGAFGDSLIAVGWLDRSQPFQTGPVSAEFFDKLLRLLVDPWQPAACGGRHTCQYCRFSGGPATVSLRNVTVQIGSANLFVPAGSGVFVAPSMIAHYIDAHDYCPPAVFQEAVLNCPEMRSIGYLTALRARGSAAMAIGSADDE